MLLLLEEMSKLKSKMVSLRFHKVTHKKFDFMKIMVTVIFRGIGYIGLTSLKTYFSEIIILFLDICTHQLLHAPPFSSSKPLSADALKPCTATTFDQKSDAICDYQEFSNSGNDSFRTFTNNKFNVKRAKLWNAILEIED